MWGRRTDPETAAGPPAWGPEAGPRVLLEHRDVVVQDVLREALEGAGFDVRTCGGPEGRGCPVLRQEPCPAVEEADVVVSGLVGTTLGRVIARRVRRRHPDRPLLVEATEWLGEQLGDDVCTARIYPLLPEALCEAVAAVAPARPGGRP